MPGIINSAPDCVTHAVGSESARVEDSADFILQANYEDCAGFMTFGPGSTYGEDGAGADSMYMILTWLGIFVTLAALTAWVIWENRQLIRHAARMDRTAPAAGPPPQPGGVGDTR
jgi:hypothetical protein